MSPLIGSFEHVFILGELPAGARLAGEPLADLTPDLGQTPEGCAPLSVRRVLAAAVKARRGSGRALVITAQPIAAPRTRSLFGYSDRRRGVAIVSTARLGFRDAERATPRFQNVLRHELGHLAGLRHCRTPGCLMHAAESVADLDARASDPCGRCPRGDLRRRAAAGASLVLAGALVFGGLDAIAGWIKPAPPRPFSCGAVVGIPGSWLLFNRAPLRAGGAPLIPCKTAAAAALNDLFNRRRRPPLDVASRTDGSALIRAGETVLLVAAPGGGAEPPPAVAQRWADDLQKLLRAKGSVAEGCPQCHVDRPRDMWYAARSSKGG